jgi:uncharacterized protein (TIGR03437 family)
MRGFATIFVSLVMCLNIQAQNVTTGNYGNSRTNANLSEAVLIPSNISPGSFGKLFSLSVDGQIYAQPLYMQNVAIPGHGTHNVVFVATMHNTVCAFDADVASTPLWSANLGPSVPASNYTSDTGDYTDITPENGILGTPVIDETTGTLYAVAAIFENGKALYRLHALDTGSGQEKFGAPSTITAQVSGLGDSSANGILPFDASQHLQRPALLLLNGVVYVAFGSHGDAVPFHGWIVSYNARNVQEQRAVFNASPNGGGGSFWQSGRGLSADADGNIYGVSSNGDTDGQTNFSECVLKLKPGNLQVSDWFAPFNFQLLTDIDDDLGASGAVLVDGTNYLLTGGKQGVIYLLDRTNLGHTGANDGQVVQTVDTNGFGIFNMALWNRPDGALLYLHTANSTVQAWSLSNGSLSTQPVAQSLNGFNIAFQGMTLSANGVTPGSGVLWVLASASYPLPSHAVLHAYNAEDMSELWNSDITPSDVVGAWVKFANPTVANGKVYVPTGGNQLLVYGENTIGGGDTTPLITGIVNAASYADGPLAPGEIVAIFGQNLGPGDLALGNWSQSGMLNSQLAATQVTFNGIPAPLLYSSNGAISAIVPYEIAGADRIAVQVTYNGAVSSVQNVPASTAVPGVFSADASGSGPGAILNSDYSLNTPDNPATGGDFVVVYATGGGQTDPPATTGGITAQATSLAAETSVTVGGVPATVLYAGNAGGEIAGVVQLNLRLPPDLTGTVPVVVTIDGHSSQATTTVSVQATVTAVQK